jgi:omega-6 fatty acid desaturase (delta-12 desaturase)
MKAKSPRPSWYETISVYQRPHLRKALWQILNSFIPYLFLWYCMILTVKEGYSYWYTLILAIVAAGLLVRIFIIFHDCCHGSFLRSKRAQTILGYLCGILSFTPYQQWRHTHWRHHATYADLDRRGVGDVWTMTKDEFLKASPWKRLSYRLFRNPLVMFGLGPAYLLIFSQRFLDQGARGSERPSVYFTNLAILAIIAIATFTIGIRAYVLIQLPVILIAGAIGIWLFYVQHQFEGVYWARNEDWEAMRAALEGSSYYKLPKALQWFTGNIGLHFIHHVRPLIPNYNLQSCYNNTPALQSVRPLTALTSLKSLRLKLWDEQKQKLVGFHTVRNETNLE